MPSERRDSRQEVLRSGETSTQFGASLAAAERRGWLAAILIGLFTFVVVVIMVIAFYDEPVEEGDEPTSTTTTSTTTTSAPDRS